MTDVEIANAALALVKKGSIQSFNDGTTEANAAKALYAPSRDKVLEDGIWSFAKGLYVLEPLGEKPIFGWENQFEFPGEAIGVIAAEDESGNPVEYEVFGRRICADEGKLYVTMKTKPEDVSLYTPGFCFAVGTLLASFLAVPLAENRQLKTDYWEQYKDLVKDARGADGVQQSGPAQWKRLRDYRE